MMGHLVVVKLLLDSGADLNVSIHRPSDEPIRHMF
jgi:hypothetical protein